MRKFEAVGAACAGRMRVEVTREAWLSTLFDAIWTTACLLPVALHSQLLMRLLPNKYEVQIQILRIYADRIAGRHCHHCDFGRAPASRAGPRQSQGQTHHLPE